MLKAPKLNRGIPYSIGEARLAAKDLPDEYWRHIFTWLCDVAEGKESDDYGERENRGEDGDGASGGRS